MTYANLSHKQLTKLKVELESELAEYNARNLSLNMARGKPASDQLDLSIDMLKLLNTSEECFAEDGTDCRNYGGLEGIMEARRLMAVLLDDEPENVIVAGNSSLTLMYSSVARFYDFGARGSKPWRRYDKIKWICPVPGYDRHFLITESFGFENIPVPMNDDGPDMDMVEEIAASDERVKGIWCVPK
ncbi:MAG TPA: aminotransferase, partial [Eggerthellaceae bacterium]|nr:aminotransferase [Eggerthellaceae bacterium]